MGPGPMLAAAVDPAVTQQKCKKLLTLFANVRGRSVPRPDEIPDRLMDRVRDPNRGQFSCAKQPRQGHRIASVGLDPVSRLLGNQRRRHHSALVTQRYNLPIEPITRWSSFVADPYLLILACQLLDHPLNRRRCAIDLAEIP